MKPTRRGEVLLTFMGLREASLDADAAALPAPFAAPMPRSEGFCSEASRDLSCLTDDPVPPTRDRFEASRDLCVAFTGICDLFAVALFARLSAFI